MRGSKEEAGRPNIVWIMCDDLSWADIGCYGQEKIRTPHIDRMAAEGMRFTACYAGATVCAPSRSSLMQGLHQGHATVRGNFDRFYTGPRAANGSIPEGVNDDATKWGGYRHSLQPGDLTVAGVLKQAGYTTGMFGKWGLATHDQPGRPGPMGFDEFVGYLNQRHAHSYYPTHLWHNTERILFPENEGHDHTAPNAYDEQGKILVNGVPDPRAARYSFDVYHEASLAFLRAHAAEPFFLYLPYTLPHQALEIPELGAYAQADWPSLDHKIYAAMVTRIDTAVGEVMDLLKELGLDEKTLVFFTSDNGYSFTGYGGSPSLNEFFQHAGPWRGRKGRLQQGGVRVPAIARWPGHIAAGSESAHAWAFWDLLPTAAELAGAPCPEKTDGISLVPTLLGRPEEQDPHAYLYWEGGDEQAARFGPYYAYREHPARAIELYHAEDDPGQATDLAAELPDQVRRAAALMDEAHEQTPYVRDPGESEAAWDRRMREAGVTLLDNVNTF